MPDIRSLGRRIPRVNRDGARAHAADLAEFDNGNLYGVWDLGTYKIFSYDTLIVAVYGTATHGDTGWDNQSRYSNATDRHHSIARAALRNVAVLHGFAYRGERGHAATVDFHNRAAAVKQRAA